MSKNVLTKEQKYHSQKLYPLPQQKHKCLDDIKYQHYKGKYKNVSAIESQDEFNTEEVSSFSLNDSISPPHSQPLPQHKLSIAINSIKI